MHDWLRDLVDLRGRAAAVAPTPDGELPPRVLSERAARFLEGSSAERADAIVELAGLVSAVMAELFDVVAAADVAGDHSEDGATDMAAWLVAMCGPATPNAREWVRVADALQSLPGLRDAFAEGRMSWDQVRAAGWFVTPELDEVAAESLPSLSASQLTRLARRCRPRTEADAAMAHRNRRLEIRADHAHGGYRYSGFLPTEQGARLNAELLRRAESAGPNPDTGAWDPLHVRMADALFDLATDGGTANVGGTVADTTCVVIHADAASIDDTAHGAATIGELALHTGGVLRTLCDCRVEVALHGVDGRTLGVGRTRRTVPWWLRRTIHHRDGTCRGPGCERRIRHLHHIVHWAHGGATDADNLVGLCWHHHHLVHEGGWTIEGDPEGVVTFVSPSGRRVASRPHPISAASRHLLAGRAPPPTAQYRGGDDRGGRARA